MYPYFTFSAQERVIGCVPTFCLPVAGVAVPMDVHFAGDVACTVDPRARVAAVRGITSLSGHV